ncbi:MAG TPA: glycosyltransferase, partial [Bryobacteraceae bacterium]|nr:glycosyltransferase [Bryobacteraceae bacterium]
MNWILLAIAAAAAVYQLLAFEACLRQLRRRDPAPLALLPVSVLKPVRGLDDAFYECIKSHALQDYPEFELLFGVSDPEDPAVREIERLICEFPCVRIRLIHSHTVAPNAKVGVLTDLAAAARHAILLVNDSDVSVGGDYLRRVVPPLSDPQLGMVTCLYRARAATWPGRMEAVGIATDFAPSVLVAPLAGVSEFALGSTMVFRAADLERIGGFPAIAEYIADDYQLSARIRSLG